MKPFFFIFFTAFAFSSCVMDHEEPCYYVSYNYEPVYLDLSTMRNVNFVPAQSIEQPGKIYVYGNYLLVNEVNKGIHLIDNSNQNSPVNVGFYEIHGNNDLAVKDNVLYADNYLDIMAIDISSIEQPTILSIEEQVFHSNYLDSVAQTMLVDYSLLDSVLVRCNEVIYYDGRNDSSSASGSFSNNISVTSSTAPTSIGQAGSMARFALYEDYLYVVDDYQLHSIVIEDENDIEHTHSSVLDWGVETIFPYQNNLFIGARTGMHIFSLENPSEPNYASTYTHFEACDPVVVSEDKAYVTVRDGNWCGNSGNELLKLDVQNIYEPELLEVMEMTSPHGLGILGDNLFICEAEEGIKVYDKENVSNYVESRIAEIVDVNAKDIILLSNQTAIVLTGDSFKQYDISDINQIRELSSFVL